MNRLIYSFVRAASRNAWLHYLSCLILFPHFANAQIEWARQSNPNAGAGGSAQGNALAIDALGNTYVVGDYTGEVVLGSNLLGNDGSVYLAKYTPSGNLSWVRFVKGSSNNDGLAIALDPAGEVYIAGQYTHTNNNTILDFGQLTLTGSGEDDLFIAKSDTAGNFLWGTSMIVDDILGGQFVRPHDMEVDAAGNITIIGAMNAPVTIDGQRFNTTNYQNNNTDQFFISQFRSDGSLNYFRYMEQENGGKYFSANDIKPASNGDWFITGLMSDAGMK
ncbi:MAG: hypothetical protein AAFQ87_09720 [Bacteroidota bacterium]